jgi:PTS system mannose-specific IIC component
MTVDLPQVALAFAWGGLCAVERRGFLQAMVSRPLVAGTGAGWLLGDAQAGLYVGLLFELYYLGAASLGAARPENDTLAATAGAAFSAGLAQANGAPSVPAVWSLGVLACAGMGPLGRWVEQRLERHAGRLAGKAETIAEAGQLRRAVRQNLFGLWPFFVAFGAMTAAASAAGQWAAPWERRLPLELLRGLAWAYPAMASVAAAIAVRGANDRRGHLYAAAAAVLVGTAAVLGAWGGGP